MKIFSLLVAVALTSTAFAQVQKGTIVYKEVVKLEFDETPEGVDEAQWAQLRAMMPSEQSVQKELLFTEKHSLYQPHVKEMDTQQTLADDESGMNFQMNFDFGGAKLFRDHETGNRIAQEAISGKDFVIEEPASDDKPQWKILGEQKKIAGYMCQKAQLSDTSKTVAWFAPSIPVSAGPEGIGGLPGMILEVSFLDENVTIQAQTVRENDVDEAVITTPLKGKKVTREKFRAIQTAKFEEMQQRHNGSGDGSIMIIQGN